MLEQGGHHLHTPVSPLFQHQDYSLSRESQVCASTLHYANQWTFMWLTRKLGRIYIQTWWGVILYLGLCTEDGNRQMLLTYDDVTVLQKCNSIEFCKWHSMLHYTICVASRWANCGCVLLMLTACFLIKLHHGFVGIIRPCCWLKLCFKINCWVAVIIYIHSLVERRKPHEMLIGNYCCHSKYTLYLVDKLMVEVWHLQFLQAAHRFIVVTRG